MKRYKTLKIGTILQDEDEHLIWMSEGLGGAVAEWETIPPWMIGNTVDVDGEYRRLSNMSIWHISDTHCLHGLLVPQDVDIVIHSGDCSNDRDTAKNTNQVLNFLDWFANLEIPHKVFVAGNHDVSIERRAVHPSYIRDLGIIYLENDSANVAGLNVWGSPITPSFGEGWAWNMARHKIKIVWDTIPEDADIVITHGPPQGVLDLSINYRTRELEFCGCTALKNRLEVVNPKLSLFGHIHNHKKIRNSGLLTYSDGTTIYSNATVVQDGKMEVFNNGNIIEL